MEAHDVSTLVNSPENDTAACIQPRIIGDLLSRSCPSFSDMRQRTVQGRRLVQLRSMLDDPQFSFQQIGDKLGFTKQRISQLAKGFGIGRQRERERLLRRESSDIEKDNGRKYARFDVGSRTRRAKAAVFAMRSGRNTKLYVVPTADLRTVDLFIFRLTVDTQ